MLFAPRLFHMPVRVIQNAQSGEMATHHADELMASLAKEDRVAKAAMAAKGVPSVKKER
jgi:hypothetical protein